MELICKNCSKKIIIPDEKIPKGRPFYVACPQCKTRNSLSLEKRDQTISPSQKPIDVTVSGSPPTKQESNEELDFIEEGQKVALVCDQENSAVITPILEELNYLVKIAKTPNSAINRIKFTVYDVIFINEMYGCSSINENSVLKYLQPMQMPSRRKMILILTGDRFRTLDNMGAFAHSVNLLVNKNDLKNLKLIMRKYIQDHERFYKIFNESLRKRGKE